MQVNKALPRVEQELENLIADWERLHQVDYLLLVCSEDFFIIAPIPDPISGGRGLPERLHRSSKAGPCSAAGGGEACKGKAEEGDTASRDQVFEEIPEKWK